MDILKHRLSAKSLTFFTSNSHAKMAPATPPQGQIMLLGLLETDAGALAKPRPKTMASCAADRLAR